MSGLRAVLLQVGGVAGAAIAGYLIILYLVQRSVLFPAPIAAAGAGPERWNGERVWLTTSAARVEAWFLPALGGERQAAPLVIFAHGNAEIIDLWPDEFEVPRRWGMAVLLVEYPGYGRSTGKASEASVAAAMAAAYDWAGSRPDVDRDRIIGYGRSLGGAAVCALARERRLAAMVLESTFTSVRAMARGYGLPAFMVRDPFDNLAAVRGFRGPLLILHGDRDEVIPPEHSRRLHQAAPRSELELYPCGHNDCARPWPRLHRFLVAQGLF